MRAEGHLPKVNILVIGTGMYVCGRGTEGYGTILPALMQAYSAGIIGDVLVTTKRRESFRTFETKLADLKELLGTDLPYRPYPDQNRFHSTYQDALRELPDPGCVIIVAPDHLHFEMALAAVEARKHVLVVKPLAPRLQQARRLADAAAKAGVYGAVEFHKRLDLANLKLREAVERKTIGDPLYFHVEYSQRKVIPTQIFSDWVDQTNIFQYLGVHYADIIYYVTQDRPRRMLATGQRRFLAGHGISTYDAVQVVIEWCKGTVSTILTNWVDPNCSPAMSYQLIKAVGTNGRFESNQTDRGVRLVTDSGGLEEINPYFCQLYHDNNNRHLEYRGYGIESILQFLKDTASIAAHQSSPADLEGRRPTFRDALVSTAIVEGAGLSLSHDSAWVCFGDDLEPFLR